MTSQADFFVKCIRRLACLFALTLGLPCLSAQSADMDLVKTRIRQHLSTGLAAAATVQSHQATLKPDGTWADIDYASTAQSYWPPRTHLSRMREMAQAYRWNTAFQGNATLRSQIFQAFDAWTSRDPQSTNWWYQAIGTPQALGEILLLMDDDVSSARLTAGVTLMARSYVPRETNSGTNTGSNRVERSYATLLRALLTADAALTSEAFLSISDTILVNSAQQFAEGIQPDGSFHQHGAQLYDAGYGYGYCQSMLKLASWGTGTAFAFANRQTRVLLDYLLDGPQWMVRGDTIDYTSYGRGISRPGSGSMALGYDSALEKALAIGGDYRRAEFLAFRTRLAAASTSAEPLTGNRNFWKSDYMVHHRPGFFVSLKTSSTRTLQPESGNGEGLKNLHLADGVTLIQRSGNEYDDIMPAWDWRRLPGTTTEQGTYSLKPTADWGVYGTSTHAGGVSDGANGAAAFAYSRLGVAAKKSWFFLGDVMIALGSGINAATATAPVITTLNQTRLSGSVLARTSTGSSSLTGTTTPANLQWVYHDGIGYFFPNAVSNGTISIKKQTGDWQSINSAFAADPVNVDVFSLQLNHGTAVNGASYAYMVAPCAGVSEMNAFPQGNYEILQNDASIQAVKDKNAGITCANFWASGTVDGLTCSAKSCVMLTRGKDFIDIALSDPTQANAGNITLELNSPVAGVIRADTGLTVIQTSPTLRVQFNAASSYGMTFKARFYLRANAYETVALEPVADAYVYDAAPNANYGSSTDLVSKLITTSVGWTRESFLRFDLASIARAPVAASLRLMPKTVQIPGIHSVQTVPNASWTESGLTWNNRPSPDAPPVARWRPVSGARTSIDVLPMIAGRSTSELNLMLATFAPTSDGTVTYGSRESLSASERPVLELVLPRAEMPVIATPMNGATLIGIDSALVLGLSVPVGQTPVVTWSVASGAGTVHFADARAVQTSATFSTPGAYTLQCTSTVAGVTDVQQVLVHVVAASDASQVLHLKLDEAVGTVAADSNGGNSGTLVGNVAWQTAGGVLSGAAAFNGTNGYIQVPDAPSLDVTTALTLSFRFRLDSLVTNAGLVSKRVTFSSENAFSTFIDAAGRLNVDVDTNNNRFTSNTVFATGIWHQVTLVFDGSLPSSQRVRLYVNGLLDKTAAEASASIPNSSGSLVVGSLNGAQGPFLNGRVDDVRLHRRVLEEWEIQSVAAGKYAPVLSPGAAPLATTGAACALGGQASDAITGSLSSEWALVSGLGGVVFENAAQLATTARFDHFGPKVLRLAATNSVATVLRQLSLNVVANPHFWADWQGMQWPGIVTNEVIGELADPDRDGLVNLTEWALGLDPKKPDPAPLRMSFDGTEWGFDYSIEASRQGLTYVVEVSDDLSPTSWTTQGMKLARVQSGSPEKWRATCDAPARDHRFFRLRLSKP